jgi:hypothetical protein
MVGFKILGRPEDQHFQPVLATLAATFSRYLEIFDVTLAQLKNLQISSAWKDMERHFVCSRALQDASTFSSRSPRSRQTHLLDQEAAKDLREFSRQVLAGADVARRATKLII